MPPQQFWHCHGALLHQLPLCFICGERYRKALKTQKMPSSTFAAFPVSTIGPHLSPAPFIMIFHRALPAHHTWWMTMSEASLLLQDMSIGQYRRMCVMDTVPHGRNTIAHECFRMFASRSDSKVRNMLRSTKNPRFPDRDREHFRVSNGTTIPHLIVC